MLRKTVKRWMRRRPGLFRLVWRAIYPMVRRLSGDERYAGTEYKGSRAETFDTIFRENRWRNPESLSGSGSTLEATSTLQRAVTDILERTKATSILDAPCGDFNWMQSINLPADVRYIGGEIVEDLVRDLQGRFGGDRREFRKLDIVSDRLPDADVWLCRHVLMHCSNSDVLRILENFADSSIRYFVADNYGFVRSNRDIASGGYRFLNLRRAPFRLPPPLKSYPNSNPPSPPDYLCLWSREQVRASFGSKP